MHHKRIPSTPEDPGTLFLIYLCLFQECVELLSELRATGEEVKSTASNEVITTHSESMAQRLWPILEKEVPEYLMGNKLIGLSNR